MAVFCAFFSDAVFHWSMLSASSLRRFLVKGGQPRRTQGKCDPEIRCFVRRRSNR